MTNEHLERAGVAERIDMRSHAQRGTGLEPEAKQLPSQWRGAGRSNVIEFRAARRESENAQTELRSVVPDAGAMIIDLQRVRAARQARQEAEAQAADGMADFRARFQANQEQQVAIAAERARLLAEIEQERHEQQIAAERVAALKRAGQVPAKTQGRDVKPKRERDGPNFGF